LIDQGKQPDPPTRRQHRDGVRLDTGHKRFFALGLLIGVIVVAVVGLVALLIVLPTSNSGSHGSASSASLPQTTPASAPLHSPPAFSASGSNGAILLSWQPSLPAPVGYRIYRATGWGPYNIVGEVNAPNIGTFIDDVDIMPGETYSYTVTAFNRNGESAPAGPAVALVLAPLAATATLPPAKPLPTYAPPAPATLTTVAQRAHPSTTSLPTSPSPADRSSTGSPRTAIARLATPLPPTHVPSASHAPLPMPTP